MEEFSAISLEEPVPHIEGFEVVGSYESTCMGRTHGEDTNDKGSSDICDNCLSVPWEKFGASDDPGSFSAREPFMAWKYMVPEGRSWPGNSVCRICRFLRELLTNYGCDSTTCIRKLYGGWDGEKPFRITFIKHDEIEDRDHSSSGDSGDEQGCCDEDEFWTDDSQDNDYQEDSENDSLTLWSDSEDGWLTFSIPSFFATFLEVEAFQSAMKGYKPTDADFGLVRSWLDECNRMHGESCRLRNRTYVRNLKVIDCSKRTIISVPPDYPYVALSYVWGPPSAQPSLKGLDLPSLLPQTIEDSINVTRKLGFKHIWIDRYCINQDDGQEKQEQIAQMADVYAAAAVTIIAVAGKDPSHGLPGVRIASRGLRRHEKLRSIRLFANPSIEPRDRYSPFFVHESKWATRAWTFQECYNSPRRLFFTDEQITLVCNAAAYQETAGVSHLPPSHPVHTNLRGWTKTTSRAPASAAVLENVPYALANAMDTLIVYSQRTMSYDSDALNAIIGTLNAFARESIEHVWGVPIWLPANGVSLEQGVAWTPSSHPEECRIYQTIDDVSENGITSSKTENERTPQRENSIALLWHNNSPRYRRSGFPSWSPLGWKEGSDWSSNSGIGWVARQSPTASGGDSLTMLASCEGIRMPPNMEPIASYQLATADYTTPGAMSQHLIAEARAVDLRLALSPGGTWSEQYRDCVSIRLDDDLDVLLAATWDKAPWEMDVSIPLKGLVLRVANTSFCCPELLHYAMIILEQHGSSWERVAIALITNNYIKTTSAVESICEFPAAHPPLFRQTSTGTLYKWDLSRWNDSSAGSLDISHLGLQPDELWWEKCSKTETVTLK